jgi:hypothetical protein
VIPLDGECVVRGCAAERASERREHGPVRLVGLALA